MMKKLLWIAAGVMSLAAASGCRTAARVATVPRVDLELTGAGNRGYLIGTPPPAGELKTTREMIQADVEIPSFYQPKRGQGAVGVGEIAPPEMESDEAGAAPMTPARYDTYVVQKGDTLWTIAKKPEIYGKATYWRRLFDANRDILSSPDRLKAGMKLKVPRGEEAEETIYEDEGISPKK
jgi:nucleoid-associated protein YgaU